MQRRGSLALASAVCVAAFLIVAGTAAAASPANDNFADAQVLAGPLPQTATGTTVEASRESGEPVPPGTTPSGHSIWFRWEAPSTEYVSINTCGSEPLTILAVYTGSALGALTEVVSNHYLGLQGCHGQGTEVTFTAIAGTVYDISVDGNDIEDPSEPAVTGEGAIALELEHPEPPANDDLAAAQPIAVGSSPLRIDNRGATKQTGEPDHRGNPGGASVWFKWTAPRSGGANFQACNGLDRQALVAVYTGSSVGALTAVPQLEATSTCEYTFFATAGTTYMIAFDTPFDPAADAAEMAETEGSLTYDPANDDFENAFDISSLWAELIQPVTNLGLGGNSNVGATKQWGEPDHAGNAGGASVWFTWTAPETGSLQLSACDADFPTLLALYTGSALTSLQPVDSGSSLTAIPCPFGASNSPEVETNIVGGTTYDIAVDGINGAEGHFSLMFDVSDEAVKPPSAPVAPAPPAEEPTQPAVRPQTKVVHRHIDAKNDSFAFSLHSSVADSSFLCALDRLRLTPCGAEAAYRHLAAGHHVFRAVAVGPTGLRDKTPAKVSFRLGRRPIPRSG